MTIMEKIEACVEISDNQSVRFAMFCRNYRYHYNKHLWYKAFNSIDVNNYFTSEQLLNLFKSQELL